MAADEGAEITLNACPNISNWIKNGINRLHIDARGVFVSFSMSLVALVTLHYALMCTNVIKRSVFDAIGVNEMSFMAIIGLAVVAYVASRLCK